MAEGDYRWRVPGSTNPEAWRQMITGQGMVNFDVFVERSEGIVDTVESWTLLDGGHFTVQVAGAQIEAISNGAMDLAEKRQAVMDLITAVVEARGLVQSDRAARAFVALLPGGAWPTSDIVEMLAPPA